MLRHLDVWVSEHLCNILYAHAISQAHRFCVGMAGHMCTKVLLDSADIGYLFTHQRSTLLVVFAHSANDGAYLLHLSLHQRRSWTALFCAFWENKKSRFSLKIRILRCFAFLCCGATRNRTGDTRIFRTLFAKPKRLSLRELILCYFMCLQICLQIFLFFI